MDKNLTGMFNSDEDANAGGARSLEGTAQLTNVSSQIAASIMATIESAFEDYRDMVTASKVNHDDMDALIAKAYDLTVVDVEFIKTLSEETQSGMLKSQQSKRSRTKGKTMTLDNYRSLMTAAVAENLLRLATGNVKSAGGNFSGTTAEYTPEALERLAADQEALRKEIRNVQSKKSIAKSKADFDESGDKWTTLLAMEAQLMSIRVGGRTSTKTVLVDQTKDAIKEMLAGKDLSAMKNADSKDLLAQITEMINA